MNFFEYLFEKIGKDKLFTNNTKFENLKNKHIFLDYFDKYRAVFRVKKYSKWKFSEFEKENIKKFKITKYKDTAFFSYSKGKEDHIIIKNSKGIFIFFSGLEYVVLDIDKIEISAEEKMVYIDFYVKELNTGIEIERNKKIEIGFDEFSVLFKYIGFMDESIISLEDIYKEYVEKRFGVLFL